MNSLPVPELKLRQIVRDCGSLLVAYSGGVDTAVLMTVAHQELGNRVMACIGRSPSLAEAELRHAMELADRVGFRCRVIETNEHEDERYTANTGDRCYFCKRHLFGRLIAIAQAEGFAFVADGVHRDDKRDHQHGMRAAREAGVRSPLMESGFTKADVRQLAQALGLPVWDKPASPCLASRVTTGLEVTVLRLRQIEEAEGQFALMGFSDVRVRHHGEIARIELRPAELAKVLEHRDEILQNLHRIGFKRVTLDLEGRADRSLPVH